MPARFFRSENNKTESHKKYCKKYTVKYEGKLNDFPVLKDQPKNGQGNNGVQQKS